MAEIEFNCPKCGKHLSVDRKGAGLDVPCPECNRTIRVPAEGPVASPNKDHHKGRIYNTTLLLATFILGGALVGSAYLLQKGMAGLGEAIEKSSRYLKLNSLTIYHANSGINGLKIDPGYLQLSHSIGRIDVNLAVPTQINLDHSGSISD